MGNNIEIVYVEINVRFKRRFTSFKSSDPDWQHDVSF